MKIKQTIVENKMVLLFTDDVVEDVKELMKAYNEDVEYKFPLGYETPRLTWFEFLGKEYQCISLWFDNEDIPDVFTE